MFQMNKQLFTQCWPAIAARIEHERISRAALDGTVPPPTSSTAAEAGYVLGVAIGYALSAKAPASTTGQSHASIPGWQAETRAELNWPGTHRCVTAPRSRF